MERQRLQRLQQARVTVAKSREPQHRITGRFPWWEAPEASESACDPWDTRWQEWRCQTDPTDTFSVLVTNIFGQPDTTTETDTNGECGTHHARRRWRMSASVLRISAVSEVSRSGGTI